MKALIKYAACAVLAASCAWAQIDAAPGETPSATPESEVSRSNVVVIGLRESNDFDDNASNTADTHYNIATVLEPHLGLQMARDRMKWSLDYRPGFSWNHQLAQLNFRSQSLDGNFEYRPTKRLFLKLRDSFGVTTNTFDQLRQNDFTPSFNFFDQPNESLFFPVTRRVNELAAADVIYDLGPHTVAGATGNFSKMHYHSLADTSGANGQPADTISTGGRAFINKHISPRNWAGLEYNYTDFHSHHLDSRAKVHSIYYTHTINFTRQMAISAFVGPEYLHDHDIFQLSFGPFTFGVPVNHSHWSWSGGATYNWAGARNSFAFSAARQVSDGAGVAVAVRLERVQAELRRNFTGKWTGDLVASYDRSRTLDTIAGTGSLGYFSISAGARRTLTRELSLDLRYWRTQQSIGGSSGNSLGGIPLKHNRASISLDYSFSHPLGR